MLYRGDFVYTEGLSDLRICRDHLLGKLWRACLLSTAINDSIFQLLIPKATSRISTAHRQLFLVPSSPVLLMITSCSSLLEALFFPPFVICICMRHNSYTKGRGCIYL